MNNQFIVIEDEQSLIVQDEQEILGDEEVYEYKQDKLCPSLGSLYNPIKSNEKLQLISKRKTASFLYFKFGKQKFCTFCQVINGEVWIQLITIQPGSIEPLGKQSDKKIFKNFIDFETSIKLLKMGKDICFSNQWYTCSSKQSWILRDFTIEQNTNSKLSIRGKTPTGYEWDQNSPDGFMQISGNFDTYGDKNQRQVNFCNRKPNYIQRNSYITVQIGVKNNQKWIVKFKQENDFLHYSEEQLPTQYGWPLSRTTWLRLY